MRLYNIFIYTFIYLVFIVLGGGKGLKEEMEESAGRKWEYRNAELQFHNREYIKEHTRNRRQVSVLRYSRVFPTKIQKSCATYKIFLFV